MSNEKYIYLTALTNDKYIPGAMALVRSLNEVGTQYRIAIMIPKEKEEDLTKKIQEYGILKYSNVFIITKTTLNIDLPDDIENKYTYWKETFFKLQAASCYEYEKVILLDCDQMAVKNIDHLFKKQHLTATICGKCVHPQWSRLSAGVLVLEPTEQFYDYLISCIHPTIARKQSKGEQAGDQDVFQEASPGWWNKRDNLFLPEIYNICHGWINELCKVENVTPKDFYMIHFPGKVKPWNLSKNYYLKIFVSNLIHLNLKKHYL